MIVLGSCVGLGLAMGFDDTARVDVQVLNEKELAIPGLEQKDFEIRASEKTQEAKGFLAANAPIDVLFLIDVSEPMKRYVEELANAADEALHSLSDQDRFAVMAFDVNTRPVMAFTNSRSEMVDQLNRLVRTEPFKGGARVTTSLIFASSYLQRHARAEARRAIIVLTGNYTKDSTDEERAQSAQERADATLSFCFRKRARCG